MKKELKVHSGILISLFILTEDCNIWDLQFTKDGKTLVSCSNDKTIRLWNVENGVYLGDGLKGHTSWVYGLSISPDDQYIASDSGDKTIRIWNLKERTFLYELNGHTGPVYGV